MYLNWKDKYGEYFAVNIPKQPPSSHVNKYVAPLVHISGKLWAFSVLENGVGVPWPPHDEPGFPCEHATVGSKFEGKVVKSIHLWNVIDLKESYQDKIKLQEFLDEYGLSDDYHWFFKITVE